MKFATCHPDRKHRARGLCRPCDDAARYAANRDKVCARVAAYRAANRDRVSARDAAYRAANPDKVRKRQATWHVKWRAANRDKARAKDATYRAANPEKRRTTTASWRAANPETTRASAARRRAALKGLTVPGQEPTPLEIKRLVGSWKLCHYCQERRASTIDHVVPIARGGLHTLSNLVAACRTCNSSKGAKLLSEWAGPPQRKRA